jgi:hypothetical protein
MVNLSDLQKAAFNYNQNFNYHEHQHVTIGSMDSMCKHCSAYRWQGEPLGLCCNNGKVILPRLKPLPDPLAFLVCGNTTVSHYFLGNIWKYNSCFQMTSFGPDEVREPGFMPTFKI